MKETRFLQFFFVFNFLISPEIKEEGKENREDEEDRTLEGPSWLSK